MDGDTMQMQQLPGAQSQAAALSALQACHVLRQELSEKALGEHA